MWTHLSLSSLGVVDEARLDLGDGFTVITGETGAGKTMVVTALGLLRGQRADAALVRHGADRSRVEAVIDVSDQPAVRDAVESAGGFIDEDELVIARSMSAQGRSRAFAGGATVPAGLLAQLADELVAVHGQADQYRLLRPVQQQQALDVFAGEAVGDVMARYRPAWSHWCAVTERLDLLRTQAQQRIRELDALQFGLEEIDAVAPQIDEEEQLVQEESRLAHADALARAAETARLWLSGEADQTIGQAPAGHQVAEAAAEISAVAHHDAALDELATRCRDVSVQLDELATDLATYIDGIDVEPARLAAVQSRRAALQGLQRKYGPDLADVLAWAQESRTKVLEIAGDEDSITELEAEEANLASQLRDMAAELGAARRAAADRLATAVDAELAQLSMASARLTVDVRETDLGPAGADVVELLFAANSGMEPRPLHKGASGGELSRLMLSLEVVLAGRSAVPTLVFDEVDAGIGGKAAVEVGRRLGRLADGAQVLAVTHLPQVAAFARHHFRVLKDDDGLVTSSSVVRLSGGERVDELARMLAGLEDSESARQHARELLELAGHTA